MAEAGDVIKEFKEAKPPEKAVIVLGIIAVIGVAWYLYQKGKQQSTTPNTATSTGAAGGQVSGYPTVGAGGTPVLPSGVNPLYDPNGNLVAFQNQPTPTTGGDSGQTQPTTTPLNWFQQAFGLKPEISQQNGQFLLVERNAGKITNTVNLKTLFPTGTTFSGAGGGLAYANVPGASSPLLLTQGGYGRPMTASNTQVAKTAGSSNH